MGQPNPIVLQQQLVEAYLKYYDTAFRLRDSQLRDERRQLLERPGAIFTDPLIEPVVPYLSTESIAKVCSDLGLADGVGCELARMLFQRDEHFALRAHQAQALRVALSSEAGLPQLVGI